MRLGENWQTQSRMGGHKGPNEPDILDHMLYVGASSSPQQQVSSDSNDVSYAKHCLEHLKRIGAPTPHSYNRRDFNFDNAETLPFQVKDPDCATKFENAKDTYGKLVGAAAMPETKKTIRLLLDACVKLPFDVLLLKPFMTYQMASAVLMKSGYETGATFVGK